MRRRYPYNIATLCLEVVILVNINPNASELSYSIHIA